MSLAKKLKIKEGNELISLNAPEPLARELATYGTLHTALSGKAKPWIIFFVTDRRTLEQQIGKVFAALASEGILWIAFPKKSSGIQTDLSRDQGWEILEGLPAQWLNLIALDEQWSAFSLRKTEKAGALTTQRRKADTAASPYVDTDKKIVRLPDDLEQELNRHPALLKQYHALAYSHRKEYVLWVSSAKREETRIARISKMIEMLEAGKKNPNER
ncbi:YdeI/OmpD-associated family protein [Rurimicrobium arvi]|uniref:Bacteriocin-protection, YdeI or OmpD-Associated n=1 Tax=Rurimicrobium arvi TaxID=2049916 RepID=A0ABP8N323_9BACT